MTTDSSAPMSKLGLASALINSSKIPLLMFDGHLKVVAVSWSFCTAFELPLDQVEGRSLAELGQGEWNIPQLTTLLEAGLADRSIVVDYETDLVRANRPRRHLVLNVQQVNYDHDEEPRVALTISDVTDLKIASRLAQKLSNEKDDLLRERATLLGEMQHRVANSLQIVASVLLLKARTVKSEETRLHLHDAHARVMSVAAVQAHLQDTLGDVEVPFYLTKLCESLATSMIGESRNLTLSVSADKATVKSHEAVSLGLIVTELVINALKHAFPGAREGRVVVTYRLTPDGWILAVTDDGIGRSSSPTAVRAGLGTTLVEALAHQLSATVKISDGQPGAKIAIIYAKTGELEPPIAA